MEIGIRNSSGVEDPISTTFTKEMIFNIDRGKIFTNYILGAFSEEEVMGLIGPDAISSEYFMSEGVSVGPELAGELYFKVNGTTTATMIFTGESEDMDSLASRFDRTLNYIVDKAFARRSWLF